MKSSNDDKQADAPSLPRLVVFDMAGTSVRDKGEVVHAFTAALVAHNVEFLPEQLNRVRGSSKRQAVLELIPESPDRARKAEIVYASFVSELAQRYRDEGVTAMEDAEQVFAELRVRRIRVALNTGFDRDITRMLLQALHWDSSKVDAVVCGDDVQQGRPAPYLIFRAMEEIGITDPLQVANVGDTLLDLEAGYNAGVKWNIGVLSGAHSREQLVQAPHTHLLSSIQDVLDLFRDQ
jgi:phosphonatase-like hydrolase